MPRKFEKRRDRSSQNSTGMGGGSGGGMLKSLVSNELGGGVEGGMAEGGEFTPYKAERPFWDKVLNQGRAGQTALQGNMAIDRARFEENLARARMIDTLKQQEVAKLASDKELGQYLLNQLNASDPLDRGRMARLAPSRAAEATSLQTANRADLERAASEANPSLVGNEWLATTKANEAKAQAEMQQAMQLVRFLQSNPEYLTQLRNVELQGMQLSNTGRERTNTQAGLDIEKAQAYNRDVMPTANQALVDQYSNASALERARRGVPGLFNSLAEQENQMALSLRPDLAYRSDTLGQGPYTAYSPGGNIHTQVPVPGSKIGLTRDAIQYQPPGFRQIGQQQGGNSKVVKSVSDSELTQLFGQPKLQGLGGSPAISSPPSLGNTPVFGNVQASPQTSLYPNPMDDPIIGIVNILDRLRRTIGKDNKTQPLYRYGF